jgi:hypothetical protein
MPGASIVSWLPHTEHAFVCAQIENIQLTFLILQFGCGVGPALLRLHLNNPNATCVP